MIYCNPYIWLSISSSPLYPKQPGAPFFNGGSFWMIHKSVLYKWCFVHQPIKNGGWTYKITPPKTNIDTKINGLEDVSPFDHGYFG